MAITVPQPTWNISAVDFGQPVANQLNAIATPWTVFNLTNTNGGTVGAGNRVSRYQVIGKVCFWNGKWEYGAGATAGTPGGGIAFTFPVPVSSSVPDYIVIGACHYVASGGTRYIITSHKVGTTVQFFGTFGAVTNGTPATSAVGDGVYFNVVYEVA